MSAEAFVDVHLSPNRAKLYEDNMLSLLKGLRSDHTPDSKKARLELLADLPRMSPVAAVGDWPHIWIQSRLPSSFRRSVRSLSSNSFRVRATRWSTRSLPSFLRAP